MCDAFSVDHMDECRYNDRVDNLTACCGTCHDRKTMHYRRCRESQLADMHAAVYRRRKEWKKVWADPDENHWSKLPKWLQNRVGFMYVRHYAYSQQPTPPSVDSWESFRYTGCARKKRRRL